jgi:hypothetical protein
VNTGVQHSSDGRWAHPRGPWRAAVGTDAPEPAAFLARMMVDTLRYGMPARRRFGPALALAARWRMPPPGALVPLLRRASPRPRPDLDAVVASVIADWPALAAESAGVLPAAPPDLSALALTRSSGLLVFLFGTAPSPLVLAKLPVTGAERIDNEIAALRAAAPAGLAPRYLGRAGEAFVQTGVAGRPLTVPPVTPGRAGALPWVPAQEQMADALARLAATTAHPAPAVGLTADLDTVLDWGGLSSRARRAVQAVRGDVGRVQVEVLRHGDTSAQNCLVAGGRFSGLVDWELAEGGVPGFDVLQGALAQMEHGVGLVRWSQELVLSSFREAWDTAPLFAGARRGQSRAAVAAGVPEPVAERMDVAFLARRLACRLDQPEDYVVTVATAAAMLEHACR